MLRIKRFRLRIAMIVVAVVAFGIAIPKEIRGHLEHSRLADLAAYCDRMAEVHERELAACLGLICESYDKKARQHHYMETFVPIIYERSRGACIFFFCDNWTEEIAEHRRGAADSRRQAQDNRLKCRELDRHLTLPASWFRKP